MAGLGGYALATIVSFFSPGVAMAIYGLIAVYYFFEHLPSTARRAGVAGTDAAPDLPPTAEPGMASGP